MDRPKSLNEVGAAVEQLIHTVETFNDHAARRLGLHATDIRCLDFLRCMERGVSPKEIVTELGLKPSSGTALLDRLENNGLIRRVGNPDDRRSVLIELVDDHEEYTLSLVRQVSEEFSAMLAPYSKQDLAMIVEFLGKVKALAECGIQALDENQEVPE
ncbi:MAG: MarR family transcriptional regulator [Maritimibacter sp.]